MPYLKFQTSNKYTEYKVTQIDSNTIQVDGCYKNTSGFGIYADNDTLLGNYLAYTTLYNKPNLGENVYQYTNNGKKFTTTISFDCTEGGKLDGELNQTITDYCELIIPIPIADEDYRFKQWSENIPTSGVIDGDRTYTAIFEYYPRLPIVREQKIAEMCATQEQVIVNGINVEISTGEVCHFNLPDYNQRDLTAIQFQIERGDEKIAWHEEDDTKQCRYFSNADMRKITEEAMFHVMFNVTYLRDLRIYINKITDIDAIMSLQYGFVIPEEYRSEVLDDFYKMLEQHTV